MCTDDMKTKDSEMTEEVRVILKQMSAGLPEKEDYDVEAFRAAARNHPVSPPSIVLPEVKDFSIDGPGGPLALRLYRPVPEDTLPVIVYFHGGGFVLGDLDSHDGICRRLADGTKCAVCSVDYRLSPEHPFPAAVDDAFATVVWINEQANKLGLQRNRMAVAGDSSGASIAAGVALRCRDTGGPRLCLQILIVPMLRHKVDTPSRKIYGNGEYGISKSLLDWYSDQYAPGSKAKHPYSDPLNAGDVSGLPPAYIHTAEFDPLRDDGEAYARLLRNGGIPVELHVARGLFHGFHFFVDTLQLAHEEVNVEMETIRRLMLSDEVAS